MADERDELLEQYLEARDAVTPHLRAQADAELAVARWVKAHRMGPADDPELAALEAAALEAEAAVGWCRAVEVAAAEAFKGETLETVMERNDANRAAVRERAAAVLDGLG